MLYDPERHEPLRPGAWDEARAQAMIEQIVRNTEAWFSPETHWPFHSRDADGGKTEPAYALYFGASGVVWALHYLQAVGAIELKRSYEDYVQSLPPLNRAWLASFGSTDFASYMMGDTGILLLSYWASFSVSWTLF